jgi:hypothetical protein
VAILAKWIGGRCRKIFIEQESHGQSLAKAFPWHRPARPSRPRL